MDITFLGTGGGVGLPNPFCRCERCEAIRQMGGKSLRSSPAVLINDDLLIDCGSDVFSSARQFGLRLDGLWTLVITHKHSDHLDPWFFWARHRATDTDLPLLTVYAPQNALDSLLGFYQQKKGWDRATFERKTFTVCRAVRAGSFKLARQYRLSFFPASHGSTEGIEAVLVGVQDARAGYLHAYDSGPFSDDAWALLRRHRFDAVALDATIGDQTGYDTHDHMSAAQTIDHARRLREEGILKQEGIALATHFVHQSSGTHEALAARYEPHGLMVAYDGLRLSLGASQPPFAVQEEAE